MPKLVGQKDTDKSNSPAAAQKGTDSRSIRGAYRKFDPDDKSRRESIINGLVDDYLAHIKERGGGKCEHGFIRRQIDEVAKAHPDLRITRDDHNNAVVKRKKEEKGEVPKKRGPKKREGGSAKKRQKKSNESLPAAAGTLAAAMDALAAATDDAHDALSLDLGHIPLLPPIEGDAPIDSTQQPKKRRGHPKGSTTRRTRAPDKQAHIQATNWVVIQYAGLLQKAKETNTKVRNGAMQELNAEARLKFDLGDDFSVAKQTVNSRVKSGNLEVKHSGEASPLLPVEVTLRALILAADSANSQLNIAEAIELMNNLIRDTSYAEVFAAFKLRRGLGATDPNKPLVGMGWWRGFLRRNRDIESKVAIFRNPKGGRGTRQKDADKKKDNPILREMLQTMGASLMSSLPPPPALPHLRPAHPPPPALPSPLENLGDVPLGVNV